MTTRTIAHAMTLLLLVAAAPATRPAHAPTSSYEKRDLDGWTVYVARDLRRSDPELTRKVLDLLRTKLSEITQALPPRAVTSLRPVAIWLELNNPDYPGGCYHPSAEWLRQNGYNPDKAGGIEFGNARNFIAWTASQPSMVLHEFAHAYHHRVLGHSNRTIRDAFANAKSNHLYASVRRNNGRTERSYAMNNDQEYFAETTEAYFGTNDFYPFVRADLEKHDPDMAAALRLLWGVDP